MSEYKRNPRGARRARKSMGRKAIVVLSLMLVLAMAAVGGTFAWLTSTPKAVVNTFTTAGIDITLTETWNTDTNGDGTADSWSAQLVPSKTYAKNPVVTIDTDETDVPIYLFVKFDETNSPSTYLDYTSTLTAANLWTKLESASATGSTVWYRVWDPVTYKNTNDETVYPSSWALLETDAITGKEVKVKDTLTKNDIPSTDLPSLTYTAYAIQQEGFAPDVEAAWNYVKTLDKE